MIKREEVEVLLLECERAPEYECRVVNQQLVAELCRTWLAVDSAPRMPVTHWEQAIFTDAGCKAPNEGQYIRLVPEADSGGEG